MRIRDRWPAREHSVSIEENAGALAYVCWQVALDGTKQLHAQKFDYHDDAQRVAVISEYLVFLIHIVIVSARHVYHLAIGNVLSSSLRNCVQDTSTGTQKKYWGQETTPTPL